MLWVIIIIIIIINNIGIALNVHDALASFFQDSSTPSTHSFPNSLHN